LSRTLHESPATLPEYLDGRTPKRKMSFPFSEKIGRAQIRKVRNFFSFWGCRVKRGGGGASMRTRQNENLFFWGKEFFRFASTDFVLARPQKGVWGMNAGGILFGILAEKFLNFAMININYV